MHKRLVVPGIGDLTIAVVVVAIFINYQGVFAAALPGGCFEEGQVTGPCRAALTRWSYDAVGTGRHGYSCMPCGPLCILLWLSDRVREKGLRYMHVFTTLLLLA